MRLNKLFDKAKKTIDQRGGLGSLKEDADELKGIAKGKGSLADKAKGAAAAIKEPGAPGPAEHRAAEPAPGPGSEQK
jgi:hypothetical protein